MCETTEYTTYYDSSIYRPSTELTILGTSLSLGEYNPTLASSRRISVPIFNTRLFFVLLVYPPPAAGASIFFPLFFPKWTSVIRY